MNFNAPLLRPLRILLFPFSLIYGLVIWIRNKLYDKGFFSSTSFNLPIISVGNLSAGGTGKSPMVEFIIRMLKDKYEVAVLSRGYKRKTEGYALANDETTALEIGDEPALFFSKFPDIAVAVGEERVEAIPQLLQDKPSTQVIILDDAFQHRTVTAGFNILLTDFHNLFTRDWFLPTGDLRDLVSSYKRADALIISKCSAYLDEEIGKKIEAELKPLPHQKVFFTSIDYGIPYHIISKNELSISDDAEILLISGIANPRPLKKYLSDHYAAYYEILYSDHHIFTFDDWKDIRKRFQSISSPNKIILTTEKDAMRLLKFQQALAGFPLYVIPIRIQFLFGGENGFSEFIGTFISQFKTKNSPI